jgi:hypothetical protein
MKENKINDGLTHPEMSDKDYWKQYEKKFDEEEDFESQMNHEINIDVTIKYSNINGELYETKQKSINCNVEDLNIFFDNLKKTIRMVDETLDVKEPF